MYEPIIGLCVAVLLGGYLVYTLFIPRNSEKEHFGLP